MYILDFSCAFPHRLAVIWAHLSVWPFCGKRPFIIKKAQRWKCNTIVKCVIYQNRSLARLLFCNALRRCAVTSSRRAAAVHTWRASAVCELVSFELFYRLNDYDSHYTHSSSLVMSSVYSLMRQASNNYEIISKTI